LQCIYRESAGEVAIRLFDFGQCPLLHSMTEGIWVRNLDTFSASTFNATRGASNAGTRNLRFQGPDTAQAEVQGVIHDI
jgi:hypothetical protein